MMSPVGPNPIQTALTCIQTGRLADAEAICRRVLTQERDHPHALHLLGLALVRLGKRNEGIELLERSVKKLPNSAEFRNNLGSIYRSLGRTGEALDSFDQAIQLAPHLAEAHNNRGNVLQTLGRVEEALDAYRSALRCRPDYAEAHNNLGNAFCKLGRVSEGLEALRAAVRIAPRNAAAYGNLATALMISGNADEADANYQRALELQPAAAGAVYNNWGTLLKEQGQIREAIRCMRKAVDAAPENASLHSNLLLTMHYDPDLTPQELFEEHVRWGRRHAEPLAREMRRHENQRDPGRRLRIGYVSGDFRRHVIGQLIGPVLAAHDREQFEIYCYSNVPTPDDQTARVRANADVWRAVTGMADAEVAELVRRDSIDILIDLSLHTAHNRMLAVARKPAPVQASWLGCPSTSGTRALDYVITDAHVDPPGQTERYHTETVLRLPHAYTCYPRDDDAPPVGPLPASANGFVTFGSLNSFFKVNERVATLWARLMREVPRSRLMLLALSDDRPDSAVRRLLERAGIPMERVAIAKRGRRRDYLALYNQIDVALDPFPYNSHITGCDALWMGVPLVTLAGTLAVGRSGMCLLSNVALNGLIASSSDEYIEAAKRLTDDLETLRGIRTSLRERMRQSPMCRISDYTRDLEQLYRQMWTDWCAGSVMSIA